LHPKGIMSKSLVLITVDCLRADHVGFMGYGIPTTPFLDTLAGGSLVFENAIVGGVPTYYSFPAVLASRHPLSYGRDVVGLSSGEETIASVLRQGGYATAAFTAGNPYLTPRFGYDLGFDGFEDFLQEELAIMSRARSRGSNGDGVITRLNQGIERTCHKVGLGKIYDELYFQYCQRLSAPAVETIDALRAFPSADVLVERAKEWLSSVGQAPFFLWLHFMDPHGPYYPKQEALEAMGCSRIAPGRARYLNALWMSLLGMARYRSCCQEIVMLYDACIRWVDEQVANLVGFLKRADRWEDCQFVFTADHGEEFLEHGARFHPPWSMKEELIHVPLLWRSPSANAGRSRTPLSHIDLAPTLLTAMEAAVPEEFAGKSRWQALQRGEEWQEPVIVDSAECINPRVMPSRLAPRVLCVRDERYKLILTSRAQTAELFDLKMDPAEQHPIPEGRENEARRRLLQRAGEHVAGVQSRDLQPRLHARLKDIRVEIETLVLAAPNTAAP
jgi:arylsulfatase A-like enzyme